MSTNKTQNFNLHSWLPADDFQLSEINANFAAVDAAIGDKTTVIFGHYAGTGSALRTITVGRPILALLIENDLGSRFNAAYRYGGLVLPGEPTRLLCAINGDSFQVQYSEDKGGLNSKNTSYIYVAWVQ